MIKDEYLECSAEYIYHHLELYKNKYLKNQSEDSIKKLEKNFSDIRFIKNVEGVIVPRNKKLDAFFWVGYEVGFFSHNRTYAYKYPRDKKDNIKKNVNKYYISDIGEDLYIQNIIVEDSVVLNGDIDYLFRIAGLFDLSAYDLILARNLVDFQTMIWEEGEK